MKKLIYIILGIIIGALGMHYFSPKEFELDDYKTEFGDFEKGTKKPRGVIKKEYAEALSKNWTKYRKPAVDSCAAMGGHKQDDRSVWWSAKEIRNYLRYSRKQADSLNYKITGYRVYLGVYGEEAGSAKCDLTTMFMVPTGIKKKNGKQDIMTNNFAPLTMQNRRDLPIGPLNDGSGGQGSYP
ncbi:hypothetical protein A8C32_02315 [Flavivirga aquatica]|uniref:Uncharacterized protein n=1 Tax=Flavivirga aquatica TaxID=1849968 RepID=A0A1E5TA87_9FLAO|nr:hypothetical protein [Flavivirga aquatica]OEK08305.1 hypothetical protein A8C32_02315 [Flavivirga aquatica]